MTYLLAKYTALFLLAALLGFALGYWFSRRKFVDVSESYEDLRKASTRSDASQWEQMQKRLDSLQDNIRKIPAPIVPKDPDLQPVVERVASLEQAVRNIPEPPPQRDVDLAPVQSELTSLRTAVKALPVVETHEPADLTPVTTQLKSLEQRVNAIPQPEGVDLAPVTTQLKTLEQRVNAIPQPKGVDLAPVTTQLKTLEQKVNAIPQPKGVDLAPVTTQLKSLEQRVNAIPQPKGVDLAPIDQRLTAIETKLTGLGKELSRRPTKERVPQERAPRKVTRKEPRILSAALYGNKDDLKKISGVGPKLEKVLNKNGVYYFWQVAEWNTRDINIIDERLDSFKGRIARDNWVRQAKQLRRGPEAARMPAD